MKRFTETTKWADPWFRSLKAETKLLWFWLLDNCDIAGVIRPDLQLASFQIGQPVDEQHIVALGDRVQRLPDGKFHIVKFVRFQFGTLSSKSNVHQSVMRSLETHGLPLPYPSPTLSQPLTLAPPLPRGCPTPKEKEKEKEKVQVKEPVKEKEGGMQGGIYSVESRVALHWLNEKSGRHHRESESSLAPINARMKEPGVDIEGVKKMIERQCARWKGTQQEEYLRPQTLFGKEKFDAYYAAKDLPIQNGSKPLAPSHRDFGMPSTAEQTSARILKELADRGGS